MSAAPGLDLRRRLVLITGGVRGLGRAITKVFAAEGAHVVVNYFHARQEAPALLRELTDGGASAELIRASVVDRAQIDAMFDEIAERHGGLDVLVNNAGAGGLGPVDELDDHYWERAWTTDLRASQWCATRAAPLIAARGGGAIVNLSSIGGGSLVMHGFGACGTAKAAVEALTRYLAVEYAARGIRANTVTSGVLDSEVVSRFPDADRFTGRVRAATPLGHRLGTQEEVARVVAFLASPAASWVTGQNILVDGGLSLGAMMLSPGEPDDQAPAERVPERASLTRAVSRYTPDLDGHDGYVRHHRLRGRAVLPGALIVDLAVQAVGHGAAPFAVREVAFHVPVEGAGRAGGYRVEVEGSSVRVLDDLATPDGKVLRRNRLCAEARVERVEGPSTANPPEPDGPPVTPPWYRDGGALWADGPFRSLHDVRVGSVATARFAPCLGKYGTALAATRVPVLLLDALLQLVLVAQWVAADMPPAHPLPVGVDEVRVHTGHNDPGLLARHGDDIVLYTDSASSATATTSSGNALMHVAGVRLRWPG